MTNEEAAFRILIILGGYRDNMSDESVKAFQELADELRAEPDVIEGVVTKPGEKLYIRRDLGPSVSTGKRDPV